MVKTIKVESCTAGSSRRANTKGEKNRFERVGLFGGTFNPIHWGHLKTTRQVKDAFDLNRVMLIPAALPPHKAPGGVADAEDRMQMIRLAISNEPDLTESFTVSDVELMRPGISYTIDTVRHFKQNLPAETVLFLILGMDAFLEIDTWKSYMDLFRLIPFIVMVRPAGADEGQSQRRRRLEAYLRSNISGAYRYSAADAGYVHHEKQTVFVFDVVPVDISSTRIRERVREGRSITSLVPENVEAFIIAKGLYL